MRRPHFIAVWLLLLVAGLASAQTGTTASKGQRILVLGDSLSAEYGLPSGSGWVALMAQRIEQLHIAASVHNASISGETSAGGQSRLGALLAQQQPKLVIIELGSNDALRGLSLAATESNLREMTRAAQAAGAKVLLLGMQMPPNYGRSYAEQFAHIFASVAKDRKAALVPFLLKGVADAPHADELFQADRIHPVAGAHPTILNNVWPQVKKLLN